MGSMKRHSCKAGTITALSPQARDRNRTSVFIDGEFSFGILTDLVGQNKLYVGRELDETQIRTLLRDETVLRTRSTALAYLAYAPRTVYQIRKHLGDRGCPEQDIQQVLQDLRELGYLDDRKYATDYATARFNHKGYGPERIRRELSADGVSPEDISEAINANIPLEAFEERAKSMVERFQDRVQGSGPKRKKKLIDYLTRRGYGYTMARELVQEVLYQSESGKNRR